MIKKLTVKDLHRAGIQILNSQDTYLWPDIRKIFKLDRNAFQVWLTHEYIVPSIFVAPKRGYNHKFSRNDLYNIALYMKMLSLGLEKADAAEYLNVNFSKVGSGKAQSKFMITPPLFANNPIDKPIKLYTTIPVSLYSRILGLSTDIIIIINLLIIKEDVDSRIDELN